jgi:hypothetical protein
MWKLNFILVVCVCADHGSRPVPHENMVGVLTCEVLLRRGRWGGESRGVLLALVYMIMRFVLAVVTIACVP